MITDNRRAVGVLMSPLNNPGYRYVGSFIERLPTRQAQLASARMQRTNAARGLR